MIVQKIQDEKGNFIPDIPQGLQYKSVTLNNDGQTYTVEFTPEQLKNNRITPAQGRAQLNREGKLSAVAAHIEQGSNEELKIFWEYSTFWDKNTPTLQSLAQGFSIDLEDFFSKAKSIQL